MILDFWENVRTLVSWNVDKIKNQKIQFPLPIVYLKSIIITTKKNHCNVQFYNLIEPREMGGSGGRKCIFLYKMNHVFINRT